MPFMASSRSIMHPPFKDQVVSYATPSAFPMYQPHQNGQRLCINGKIYIKISSKSSLLSLCNSTVKSDSVFSTHVTICFCLFFWETMHHSHPTADIIMKTKVIEVISSSSHFFSLFVCFFFNTQHIKE